MQPDQQPDYRPDWSVSPSVASLEGRALLSHRSVIFLGGTPGYPSPTPTPSPTSTRPTPVSSPTPEPATNPIPDSPIPTPAPIVILDEPRPASTPPAAKPPRKVQAASPAIHQLVRSGVVTKSPHFYSYYAGPKRPELNAVKASARLLVNGDFTFTGTNQGPIAEGPAVYVWGLDRNGNLPTGPFAGRPNIKFDALTIVQLDALLTPTAQVVDLVSGITTELPAGSARISGRKVTVTVSGSLLPSTGLEPVQFRFNYWPEDGGPPVSSSVASFAPEFTSAPVGMSRRG
jgi:hypothetical protein